ncbi:hypothetical protein FRC14_002683 [Serendipita sp. 396]|nr:hypothetical protein FRC14_002683 [Serendipita sp. 396]
MQTTSFDKSFRITPTNARDNIQHTHARILIHTVGSRAMIHEPLFFLSSRSLDIFASPLLPFNCGEPSPLRSNTSGFQPHIFTEYIAPEFFRFSLTLSKAHNRLLSLRESV